MFVSCGTRDIGFPFNSYSGLHTLHMKKLRLVEVKLGQGLKASKSQSKVSLF